MGAVGKAFESIGSGIKNAFEGAGKVIKGAFTLDLKGVAAGAKQAIGGVADVGRGVAGLSPPALAANTLMDGAVDKLFKGIQDKGLQVAGKVIDGVEGGMSGVKNGVFGAVDGLVKGDLGAMVGGMANAAGGAFQLAGCMTPAGLARTAAMAALETGLETMQNASPKRLLR